MVGMELIDPAEGLEEVREAERNEEWWKARWKDRMCLGADRDHPEGIYAKGGSDLVHMTCDEWRHWYGGCGDSSGVQEGAGECSCSRD